MIQKCRICGKEIKTYVDVIGRSSNAKTRIISDEGVLFHNCIWFCNGCYAEIIKFCKLEGSFDVK